MRSQPPKRGKDKLPLNNLRLNHRKHPLPFNWTYLNFRQKLSNNDMKKWKKLAEPEETFNEILVKEFYANAYPVQRHDKLRRSWVSGTFIHYDRDAINDFLGGNFLLRGDGLDTFSRLKKNMHLLPHVLVDKLCLPSRSYEVGRTGNPVSFLRKDVKTLGPQPLRQPCTGPPKQDYSNLIAAIQHLGQMTLSNHLALQSLNQSLYQQHQLQYYGGL
ncbi:hypothetical protein VNO78_07957 [Psophocarpus tetragonolobus]|uniref:Putative plant transposon protein domain-containing protein n=1 Tax=Psophocarpus tetragonolobus TaxID=3891 RepID=A0AAN9SX30_PSOTE